MAWSYELIKDLFSENNINLLSNGKWGLEKESQRVVLTGDLALTSHPEIFGDKLENPYITTDFSESQVELITPAFETLEETYESLKSIQISVEREIGNELLWPLSMPPRLPDEKKIPIAKFNNSIAGREKEIYRNGLALRYGKKMQMISGIHFNFSLSSHLLDLLHEKFGISKDKQSFINDTYLGLIRNYLRYRWLLIYLFGASPKADSTYYPVICKELDIIFACCPECQLSLDKCNQYATSLRVSRFGYSYTTGMGGNIYYNSLEEYINKLRILLSKKSRKYSRLGVYRDGVQVQLNDNILQTESEYYSSIRPKQILKIGESQLAAIEQRGIKYLEIRILDLNPFEKLGVSMEQLLFMQIFTIYCLFEESNFITIDEMKKINNNHNLVALCGRNPDLQLCTYDGKKAALKDWGIQLFKKLKSIAVLMDGNSTMRKYQKSLEFEYKKLINPLLLPSSLIISEMKNNNESFLDFGIRRAKINIERKY